MHEFTRETDDAAQLKEASKKLDEQTKLVVSMRVGDPRMPSARYLLDEMHKSTDRQKRTIDITD